MTVGRGKETPPPPIPVMLPRRRGQTHVFFPSPPFPAFCPSRGDWSGPTTYFSVDSDCVFGLSQHGPRHLGGYPQSWVSKLALQHQDSRAIRNFGCLGKGTPNPWGFADLEQWTVCCVWRSGWVWRSCDDISQGKVEKNRVPSAYSS